MNNDSLGEHIFKSGIKFVDERLKFKHTNPDGLVEVAHLTDGFCFYNYEVSIEMARVLIQHLPEHGWTEVTE